MMDPRQKEALRRAVPRRGRFLHSLGVIAYLLVGEFCLMAPFELAAGSSPPDLIAMTAGFLAALLLFWLLIPHFASWLFLRTVACHYRAARQCPCCGYNLNGCPREEDGCTPCPECGAAWKLPEPTAPAANPPVA